MLDQLKDRIPAFVELQPKLSKWLDDSDETLASIYGRILEHFGEYDDDKNEGLPSDIRNGNVIEFLIRDLPVNRLNCERILAFLLDRDSFDGYYRLLTDFRALLTSVEREKLISDGNRLFPKEATVLWVMEELPVSTTLQSAPARALNVILRGSTQSTNAGIIILDYRHEATFRNLWLEGLSEDKPTIAAKALSWEDGRQQVLIIGNEPPDGVFDDKVPGLKGINFRSHFTATSWLAAWKVRFSPTEEERKVGSVEAHAKIAVIDPRESRVAEGTARSLQTILGAKDRHGHSLVPGVTVLNAPSLAEICGWLSAARNDAPTISSDARYLLDLLKTAIWNELTSTSEKHHAISNVLGPMILSGKPEADPPELDHVTLLRRLLSACGLVSWEGRSTDGSAPKSPQAGADARPPEKGEGLSILLLDDQARQGWEDWVKECLSLAAGSMQVAVDPNALVDQIHKALSAEQGNLIHKDARFRLELPGLDDASHPVLLLDLRLFSGNERVEGEFLKDKLLPLVDHFTDKPDLAWPGFSSKDKKSDKAFRDAKAAVLRGKLKVDSPQHHEVLTWLPRVVALADMSLPIILFSSTGRRDLVEAFKPYGNIITSFEKPRLNDLVGQNATEHTRKATARTLGEAVAKARQWLKVRTKCLGLRSLSIKLPRQKQDRQKLHVELYIDEDRTSNREDFAVGGVFAVFNSSEQADEFEDCCVRNGLRYFDDIFFTPNVADNAVLLKHNDNGTAQLTAALNEFRAQEKQVDLGFVRLRRGAITGEQHPLTEDEEDLRFWRMLEAVIEIFCAESLPAIQRQFKAESISVAVLVGTRMIEFRRDGDFSYRGNIPVHDLRDGSRKLRCMGERDAFPVVLSALSLHGLQRRFTLERAAALALPYKMDPNQNLQHKTDLDRVLDRQAVAVWEFSHERDSDMPAHRLGTTVFGRTKKPNYDFVFVQVQGLQDNVYCHENDFPELNDPNRGVFVSLVLNQGQRGYFGTNVTSVNREDCLRWIRANGSTSAAFLNGRNCNDFRPDYRALHYVADQVLRVVGQQQSIGPFTPMLTDDLAGRFNEDYTQDLEQSLVASRILDGNGHLASALRSLPVQGAKASGSLGPDARAWIAHRIWERLKVSQGEALVLPQVLPLLRNQDGRVGPAEVRQSEGPANPPAPARVPPPVVAPLPYPTACKPPTPAPPLVPRVDVGDDLAKSIAHTSTTARRPLAEAEIATNEAWLGPVPRSMDSSSLAKEFSAQFQGWVQQGVWAGGNQKGWWMPVKREKEDAPNLPLSISLLGQSFQITSSNPDGPPRQNH